MTWQYTYDPILWPALVSLALTIILGWYSWYHRQIPGAKPFFFACLFGALWSLGAALEISAVDFEYKVFWIKFQTIWQLPSATAIFCFILAYAGFGRWLTRRLYILLGILPILALILVATNDYWHLVWSEFQMGNYVINLPGSANRILVGYAYLLSLVNFIVLVRLAFRSPRHRWPVGIMLFGQLIGRSLYLVDNIKIDFMTPGESVFVVVGFISSMYAIALFRFHVFDPVPLARSAVIEQMQEGMLVLDLQGRIADLNSAAGKIFGLSRERLRGQMVTEVLPTLPKITIDAAEPVKSSLEITLGTGKDLKHYGINISSLVDKRDQVLGQMILFHDITEEKRAQERILEQQQAVATLQERERLARELHDSTGQVLGYVNLQVESIRKWIQAGNNEKAESQLKRLAEVAKEAHSDVRESILNLKAGSAQGWDFLPALKRYLEEYQNHYGIQTKLNLKDEMKTDYFKPGTEVQLFRVIQEAMTNARKHSQALNVNVTIDQEGNWGRITVADDGIGFHPDQIKSDANHHFGLAFMNERMAQIGGFMKVESQPGKGTMVKLEVPIKN